MEIAIVCDGMHGDELREFLLSHVEPAEGADVSVRVPAPRFRAVDPTVLVAIVGASSGAIGALLTGLFQLARERRSEKVTLQGSDGARIEVPADTPSHKLDELVETVRAMSRPTIALGATNERPQSSKGKQVDL